MRNKRQIKRRKAKRSGGAEKSKPIEVCRANRAEPQRTQQLQFVLILLVYYYQRRRSHDSDAIRQCLNVARLKAS